MIDTATTTVKLEVLSFVSREQLDEQWVRMTRSKAEGLQTTNLLEQLK